MPGRAGRFPLPRRAVGRLDPRHRVAIGPGTYVLEPVVAGSGPPAATPRTVVVPRDGYVEVALTVDTGIR